MTAAAARGGAAAQLELIPLADVALSAPRAVQLQGDYDAREVRMTELARLGGRTRRHWWGVRRRGRDSLAWCFLCDQAVARWSARFDPAPRSCMSIQHHRDWHLGEADHK